MDDANNNRTYKILRWKRKFVVGGKYRFPKNEKQYANRAARRLAKVKTMT